MLRHSSLCIMCDIVRIILFIHYRTTKMNSCISVYSLGYIPQMHKKDTSHSHLHRIQGIGDDIFCIVALLSYNNSEIYNHTLTLLVV